MLNYGNKCSSFLLSQQVYPELTGQWSRGGLVLDHRQPERWQRQPNATMVTKLEIGQFKKMLNCVFSSH